MNFPRWTKERAICQIWQKRAEIWDHFFPCWTLPNRAPAQRTIGEFLQEPELRLHPMHRSTKFWDEVGRENIDRERKPISTRRRKGEDRKRRERMYNLDPSNLHFRLMAICYCLRYRKKSWNKEVTRNTQLTFWHKLPNKRKRNAKDSFIATAFTAKMQRWKRFSVANLDVLELGCLEPDARAWIYAPLTLPFRQKNVWISLYFSSLSTSTQTCSEKNIGHRLARTSSSRPSSSPLHPPWPWDPGL